MSTTLTTTATWYRGTSAYPAVGCYGYDGWPLTSRHKFHTPSSGATSLSFQSTRHQTGGEYAWADGGANFRITSESTGYESAVGDSGTRAVVSGGKLTGSEQIQLMPDTDYYLWIWPRSSTYCRVQIGTIEVTVDGTYGTPSTVSASDGSFGGSIPVSLGVSTQGAVHTVSVSCAGRTEVLLQESSATSCVWTPDLAVYAALLPNSDSAQAVITCSTAYGGNTAGTSTVTITVSFPQGGLAPVLTSGWAAAAPYNTGQVAGMSGYIQGYSKAEVSFDASKVACKYGASVAGYKIRCGGITVSASPYRTGVLTGTAEIICSVTDSRGQEASETLTVTVESYAAPRITDVSVFRCGSSGTADDTGQYYSVKGRMLYSDLNGENTAALTVAHKLQNAAAYGSETPLQNNSASVISGLSADSSYSVRLTATDSLGNTATVSVAIATQVWAMKFRPDGLGVGFGKAPEHSKCIELPADWVIRIGNTVITGS